MIRDQTWFRIYPPLNLPPSQWRETLPTSREDKTSIRNLPRQVNCRNERPRVALPLFVIRGFRPPLSGGIEGGTGPGGGVDHSASPPNDHGRLPANALRPGLGGGVAR